MKKQIALAVLAISFAVSGQAFAHGGKPKHGGVLQNAADLSFELVARDGKAVIYIDDHGKELATAGASGTITVLAGASKTEAVLEPMGTNALVSKSEVKFERGNKAVASITLPGKEAISVRFSRK